MHCNICGLEKAKDFNIEYLKKRVKLNIDYNLSLFRTLKGAINSNNVKLVGNVLNDLTKHNTKFKAEFLKELGALG